MVRRTGGVDRRLQKYTSRATEIYCCMKIRPYIYGVRHCRASRIMLHKTTCTMYCIYRKGTILLVVSSSSYYSKVPMERNGHIPKSSFETYSRPFDQRLIIVVRGENCQKTSSPTSFSSFSIPFFLGAMVVVVVRVFFPCRDFISSRAEMRLTAFDRLIEQQQPYYMLRACD